MVEDIKKLGFLYGLAVLFDAVVEILDKFNYTAIYSILLFGIWYFFIKNISLFYDDKKLQRQNITSIIFASIGFLGMFMVDESMLENSIEVDLGKLLLFVFAFILLIIGVIISLIVEFKLYKLTQIKCFLYYFISTIFMFIVLIDQLALSVPENYSTIFYVAYCVVVSSLFARGILEFHRQNSGYM